MNRWRCWWKTWYGGVAPRLVLPDWLCCFWAHGHLPLRTLPLAPSCIEVDPPVVSSLILEATVVNKGFDMFFHIFLNPFYEKKKRGGKKNQTTRFMRTTIFTLPHLVAKKQRKQNQTSFLFLEPSNLRPCSCIQTFSSPDSLHFIANETWP